MKTSDLILCKDNITAIYHFITYKLPWFFFPEKMFFFFIKFSIMERCLPCCLIFFFVCVWVSAHSVGTEWSAFHHYFLLLFLFEMSCFDDILMLVCLYVYLSVSGFLDLSCCKNWSLAEKLLYGFKMYITNVSKNSHCIWDSFYLQKAVKKFIIVYYALNVSDADNTMLLSHEVGFIFFKCYMIEPFRRVAVFLHKFLMIHKIIIKNIIDMRHRYTQFFWYFR